MRYIRAPARATLIKTRRARLATLLELYFSLEKEDQDADHRVSTECSLEAQTSGDEVQNSKSDRSVRDPDRSETTVAKFWNLEGSRDEMWGREFLTSDPRSFVADNPDLQSIGDLSKAGDLTVGYW